MTEGADLDAAGMKRTVDQFLRSASGAQVALLFYAGHGMQIDGRNYLVPVDAKVGSAAELVASMIDVDTILAGLDDQVRTNILILDACRDNPLAQKVAAQAGASRSVNVAAGLAAPSGLGAGATRGAGTLIAFATAPGQVALDGTGANSPFSSALVHHVATIRARSAADADPRARGCGRRNQQQAGAVVELLAARRGFSRRREVAPVSHIPPDAVMVLRSAGGRPA